MSLICMWTKFHFHMKGWAIKTRFEEEAKGNSEMAYFTCKRSELILVPRAWVPFGHVGVKWSYILRRVALGTRMMPALCVISSNDTFSSPEAALPLFSPKNHDLWPGPTPEVRDSRTSRYSAQAQSQVWQIWLVLVSIYCVYQAIQNRNVVGPGQRSWFLVLTKRSAASGDENANDMEATELKDDCACHYLARGNNRILHIRFYCAVRSLLLWYLWRMPEMDAPRVLVYRPLFKGNEALGTRLR